MRHHLLRLPFMLLLAPAILAAQAADPFAAAVTAHGGAAVAAVQRIRITGQSTRGGMTVPVTISAIMDGRLRLDYGQTAARSIVRAPAPFDLVNGQRIPKPAHTGAFAQLDMLSILGVVPYLGAPVIHRGRRAAPAGALDRYETGTSRQQVHYRRTL